MYARFLSIPRTGCGIFANELSEQLRSLPKNSSLCISFFHGIRGFQTSLSRLNAFFFFSTSKPKSKIVVSWRFPTLLKKWRICWWLHLSGLFQWDKRGSLLLFLPWNVACLTLANAIEEEETKNPITGSPNAKRLDATDQERRMRRFFDKAGEVIEGSPKTVYPLYSRVAYR